MVDQKLSNRAVVIFRRNVALERSYLQLQDPSKRLEARKHPIYSEIVIGFAVDEGEEVDGESQIVDRRILSHSYLGWGYLG